MSKVYKTLAFLLSFIMIFTALPVAQLSAFAAEPTKLTEPWAPSTLVAEDWTGNTDKITDGVFDVAATQNTYTIWTAENYDFSDGVVFKGTLAMKNGYNNYYGEWCSVYLGTATSNLELRIKNDDDTADNEKDNTYTAYLLYNGAELASCDMHTSINGQYQLTYANGKVNVKLGGADIIWTLTNQTTSTKVDVNANLSNAKLGLRLSGNWAPEGGRRWSGISLAPVVAAPVLTGTGVEFGSHLPPVPADWSSNGKATVGYYHANGNPTGNINISGNNVDDAVITYKDTFDATNGFSLNYCANSVAITKNYAVGKLYHGIKFGNITAGIEIGTYNENYVTGTDNCLRLVIKIDGETVATSDPIFSKHYGVSWNDSKENVENFALYLQETVLIFKRVYSLVYDPETDTLSFTNGNKTATYSGVSNQLQLDNAPLALVSNNSWNVQARYTFLKLLGDPNAETPTPPEIVTLPDVVEAPNTPIIPDAPIPNDTPATPNVYGEELVQLLWQNVFETADWTGDTNDIDNGYFEVGKTNDIYTIWTAKNYNFSKGFAVNGYLYSSIDQNTKYVGEWCSIYIGSENNNLELRIRNDDFTPNDSIIDKTFTAYLYYNGSCIATSDLQRKTDYNYFILYKEGNISVAKGGTTITWTLHDGSTTTQIPLHPYFLANVKVGLRLQGNSANEKSWSNFYISPVPTGNKCGENATWTYDSNNKTLYINGTGELYSQRVVNDTLSPWIDIKTEVKNVVIADGITLVGRFNFDGFTALENVTIPHSVTTLDTGVFYNCSSLKNITIPDGVTTFAGHMFAYCTSLESVSVPSEIDHIGASTFFKCTSLKKVVFGKNIESIEFDAFWFCTSLEEITIPKTLTIIDPTAFYYCSNLKTVYYTGSEADKNNMTISDDNTHLFNATWHYNSCLGATEHTYNNAVDTDCNICGDIREVNYTGWLLEGNTWYYYQNNVTVTGWQQIGYTWYYFNDNGAMQTGWLLLGDTWYYFGDSGNMLTGWQYIGYNWYYFNSYGAMLTGWQQIGYAWYYFGDSGNMLTGWQYIGNTWYYFGDSGNMLTGWQYIGSTWYYFADGGNMLTGWQQIGYTWYYFNEGGAMLTGWQYIGGTWYYFGTSGNMLTGWQQIGYTWYYFNEGGAMLTGWHLLGGNWYYFNEGGAWIA